MKTIEETYTYWEYINHLKKASFCNRIQDGTYDASSKEVGDSDWYGTKTFEEAMDLAMNGWDAGINQLPITDGVLSGAGVEFNPSVQGAVVNVPNYLMGLPDSMWEMSEKREYNLPELEIYFPVVASSGVSGERIMNRCKEIIEYINKMQQTHQVRVISFFDSMIEPRVGGAKRSVLKVVTKDFNDRFVLNNIAFAFHASFFRRLWFRYSECNENIFTPYTYGKVSDKNDSYEYIQNSAKRKAVILPGVQYYERWSEEYIIKINH